MKKLFLGIVSLAVFSPSAFAAVEDHNKITMVTYFPVPYVAYSEINPSKQLDIGLSNTCSLKLGCSEAEHTFDNNTQTLLTVTNLNVKNGRLNLNAPSAAVVNKNTTLGTSFNGAGEINFKTNARMQTLKDALSVSTDNMELSTLKLFPDHINNNFPACAGEDMAWQKVKLRNTEEVYLVCGTVKEGEHCQNEKARTYWNAAAGRCECPAYGGGNAVYYAPSTDTCCVPNITGRTDEMKAADPNCWTRTSHSSRTWQLQQAIVKEFSNAKDPINESRWMTCTKRSIGWPECSSENWNFSNGQSCVSDSIPSGATCFKNCSVKHIREERGPSFAQSVSVYEISYEIWGCHTGASSDSWQPKFGSTPY